MKEPEIVATGRSDLYPAIMRAFSQSLRILVNLKEKHPQTYQILNAKLEEPV